MQATINYINSLEFEKALFFGVGVPSMFYDKIKGKKHGIDKYDYKLFPRSWSHKALREDIQSRNTKKKFDLIVINDSKHYKDLDVYFKQALKNLSEGGKIIFTHSIPKLPIHITKSPKKHQNWCGDVPDYVMDLISKGGYNIESFEYDLGVSVVDINESVEGKDLDIGGFEEFRFNRKYLMNIE